MLSSIENKALVRKEIAKKAPMLSLALSVNPRDRYSILTDIGGYFGVRVSLNVFYPEINQLMRKGYMVRWRDPYHHRGSKMCMTASGGEEYLIDLMKVWRAVLNYASPLPTTCPSLTPSEMKTMPMKKMLRNQILQSTEILFLSSLVDGPKCGYNLMDEMKKDFGVESIVTKVMETAHSLLGRKFIKPLTPRCPVCGKPPGWVFDEKSGRPKLMYEITADGVRYLTDSFMANASIMDFVINSYTEQKENPANLDNWPFLKSRKIVKPYVIHIND